MTHFFTKAVHAGTVADPLTGAIMTPIYQTSTYVQEAPAQHKGFDYSRAGNPTRDALEKAYAELEDTKFALSFSSGLAAEQAIIQALDPPCEVLVCDDVYGGTGRLFRRLFAKYQLNFHFIDMTDVKNISSHINKNTKMVWVETPTNPTMTIIDIQKVAEMAKKNSFTLVVDNTFASPMFQNPIQLGADIVIHSTTKYIGGHSDIIGGAIMTSDQELYEKIKFVQFAAGAVPSPMECFLLLRSIKTLGVRMMQHEKNVHAVSNFLEKHPQVEKVFFPGSSSHPQYDVAKKQMTGFSGMLSFNLKGNYEKVEKFLSRLKIFALAESLGGVESLVNHPARMTHASVPEELRLKLGITDQMLRLSIGIENTDDLLSDLKNALM